MKVLRFALSLFVAVLATVVSVNDCLARPHNEWIQIIQQVFESFPKLPAISDSQQQSSSSNAANFFSLDPKIPTPESYLGYEIGSDHVRHHEIVGYAEKLCELSPRLQKVSYGKTHEGRKLFAIVAARPDSTQNTPSKLRQLLDLRMQWQVSEPETQKLIDDVPSVLYMAYSVHGNEAAPANAAMLVLYFLAAAQGDWMEQILEQSIVIIDPCLNPDGFDRFAGWLRSNRGAFPSENPADREHSETHPSSRTNHYGFDLNRDWLPATQPESKGRLKFYYEWAPNLVMDFHEMSASQSLFFQPGIDGRDHPWSPPFVRETTEKIAQQFSKILDSAGERYFTSQRFDDFYPGKGSTFSDLQGGVGVLVEQGTTSGLLYNNGEVTRTFADTIANPLRLSVASLAAINREHRSLMEYQREFFRQSSRGDASIGSMHAPACYLVRVPKDHLIAQAWLSTLAIHNIKIFQLEETFSKENIAWPAESTWVIPSAQQQSRYLHAMMERRREFTFSQFYDVSAWNLAEAFGLEWTTCNQPITVGQEVNADQYRSSLQAALSKIEIPSTSIGNPALAVDCGQSIRSMALGRVLIEAKLPVRMTSKSIVVINHDGAERPLTSGSFVLLKSDNLQDWKSNAAEFIQLCRANFYEPIEVSTGLSKSGIDLGSSDIRRFKISRVGIVLNPQTQTSSAGSLWFVFDHIFHWPVVRIDRSQLDTDALTSLDVLIFPEAYKPSQLAMDIRPIQQWLLAGGKIIAIGNGISDAEPICIKTLTDQVQDYSQSQSESLAAGAAGNVANRSFPSLPSEFDDIPGTQFQAFLSPDCSVANFVGTRKFNFVQNGSMLALDLGRTKSGLWKPIAKLDRTSWLSGFLTEQDNLKLNEQVVMAEATVGDGKVTLMTFDPTFRGHYWDTINLLRAVLMAD